ncbi:MAG TPA: PHP domain-containing protein [Candidatus Sulfotelmatobacter sp.]|nr:PHP domain-containing protein [Candidatus Sulfotelmatobacter sp.]
MSWTFVGHVHTRHSFDSLTDPTALARHAAALKIDVLAVTDHDTWRGALDTREAAARLGLPLMVILASEVATDQGDVIALFLRRDLRESSAPRLCDAIHEDGGLVLLPHAFKWHRLDEELLKRVDLIEVHNARTGRADNTRALELAHRRGLPELVGPDAHRLGELNLARVEFEGDRPADDEGLKLALKSAPRRFHLGTGSIWNEWLSQGAKFLRQPSFHDAFWLVRSGLRRLVKPGEYVSG